MENKNKVATARKGGVSAAADREPTDAINDTNREGFLFKIPECFPSTQFSWSFVDNGELHKYLEMCQEYNHNSEDVVFIVNFKAKTVHHVLYPEGSCDGHQAHS